MIVFPAETRLLYIDDPKVLRRFGKISFIQQTQDQFLRMNASSLISSAEHDQANISFSEADLEQIAQITQKYPTSQAAVMPVLWMAQKKWGWLSIPVLQLVAETLGLPFSHVQGVASFYTMYWKRPMGKQHVQVCTNISCLLRGGEDIYRHVSNSLGIGHMERTEDGKFSLEEVECMGACGGAPMIVINEDYYENVTIEEVDRLLDSRNRPE